MQAFTFSPNENIMSRQEIADYLPHKGSWLLLDAVVCDLRHGTAVGTLHLTQERESFVFGGHEWAMPGVLIAEFASQTCAVLAGKLMGITAFGRRAGILLQRFGGVYFHGKTLPGATLTCYVVLVDQFSSRLSFNGAVLNERQKLVCRIEKVAGVILGVR